MFFVNRFLFIFFIQIIFQVENAMSLEARWLGVAGLMITDGKTTLFFDPVFTKPTFKHWLFGQKFLSNKTLVEKRLKEINVEKAQGLFCSHTHFDHAVDASMVASLTGATIYGGPSLKNLVTSQIEKIAFKNIVDHEQIKIGLFTVQANRREHSPIFGRYKFLQGEINENFKSKFYQYKEGETWNFYVEHPEGNILIDQGSRYSENTKSILGKVSVHFVGVANKLSLKDLVENNIAKVGAKKVFPLHFDFFLFQSNFLERMRLPGTGLNQIGPYLKKISPNQDFIIQKLNDVIKLP